MNPNIQQIKRLLSLYDSGLSSLRDEAELKSLIEGSDELPDDMRADTDLMMSTATKPDVDVPADLPHMLSKSIDRMARKEKISKRGNRWMALSGIAASLVIMGSVGVFLLTNEPRPTPYEITDPEEASRMTMEALITVAHGLREADDAMKESCMILNKILNDQPVDSSALDEFGFPVEISEGIDTSSILPSKSTII